MIAKAGLGVIGLSAISVGGVALTNPRWLGMGDPMPSFHYLSDDKDFSDSSKGYSNGKFGKTYGRYLVGATNKNVSGGETKNNKDWWEWAYRKWDGDKPESGKFSNANVDGSYSENKDTRKTPQALNQVCKEAYGKSNNEFWTSTGGDSNNKFKKSDVWKYCSPGTLTHTNKDNPLYTSEKIGGDENNKTILVSVKDSSNDWFWKIRDEDFWKENGDWSGKNASGEDPNKSLFKKHYEDKKSSTDGRKTIKKLCEDAYKEDKGNEADNKNNTDAKKFCSLEKTT